MLLKSSNDTSAGVLVRICQFHAIKYLSSVICETRFSIPVKIRKKLRHLFSLIARASTEQEFGKLSFELKE
jgi:hypothetical protein